MVRTPKKSRASAATENSGGFSLFDEPETSETDVDEEELPKDEAGRAKIKQQYVELLGIRIEKLKGRILNRERINKTLEGIYFICSSCAKVCHNLDEGLVEDDDNQRNVCQPCHKTAASAPAAAAKAASKSASRSVAKSAVKAAGKARAKAASKAAARSLVAQAVEEAGPAVRSARAARAARAAEAEKAEKAEVVEKAASPKAASGSASPKAAKSAKAEAKPAKKSKAATRAPKS
jgi:hypothetical protein